MVQQKYIISNSLDMLVLPVSKFTKKISIKSHKTFTCSNSTIETPENEVKCLKLTVKAPEQT